MICEALFTYKMHQIIYLQNFDQIFLGGMPQDPPSRASRLWRSPSGIWPSLVGPRTSQ